MRRLALVVGMAIFAAACGGGSSGSGITTQNLGTIKVGGIFPLSGNIASAGTNDANGVRLAVDVLNGKYPQIEIPKLANAKIELVAADSQGDPQIGASDVDRLVTTDKVAALIGAYQSAVSQTASERAERLGVPFMNDASGAASLSERGLQWWFRPGPTYVEMGQSYFDFMKSIQAQHPVKKIVIMHMNDAAGTDFSKVIRSNAQTASIQILDDITVQPNTPDFTSQVQRVRSLNPDALFVVLFINDASLFLKTSAQLGYTPPAILAGGGGWDDPTFATVTKPYGLQSIRAVTWGVQVTEKNKLAKQADEQFMKNYGIHMNGDSARSFTSMILLGQAIDKARSTDPEKIRAALRAMNVPGDKTIMPWPAIKFDSRGQNTQAGYLVLQLTADKDWQVLFPKELATSQLVWPMAPFNQR
jgi:branched-chain amino acid transport system substrate-binding protein